MRKGVLIPGGVVGFPSQIWRTELPSSQEGRALLGVYRGMSGLWVLRSLASLEKPCRNPGSLTQQHWVYAGTQKEPQPSWGLKGRGPTGGGW